MGIEKTKANFWAPSLYNITVGVADWAECPYFVLEYTCEAQSIFEWIPLIFQICISFPGVHWNTIIYDYTIVWIPRTLGTTDSITFNACSSYRFSLVCSVFKVWFFRF